MPVKRQLFFVLCFCLFQMGCLEMGPPYSKLPPGPWRGVLKLDPERQIFDESRRETKVSELLEFDEVTEGDLPFNFDVVYTDPETLYLEIRNGEEKIKLDKITYLRDRATNKDTVVVQFPPYDSYLKMIFEDNILEGYWHVPALGSYAVHVVARHGQNHRFTNLRKKPLQDISGKWDIQFSDATGESLQDAIGEFKQTGNELTGTFITAEGDFGFLEGTVQADKMYLSGFNGANMYLIEAIINPDKTLSGILRNGIHVFKTWNGKHRSDTMSTHVSEPNSALASKIVLEDLEFADIDGAIVNLDTSVIKGKPTIIQIVNTSSYNSVMQTIELNSYLNEHPNIVKIVGLSRNSLERIRTYSSSIKVNYPILRMEASSSSTAKIQSILGDNLTTSALIFLDESQLVKGTLTGFFGPASQEYPRTKAQIGEMIDQIR